MLLKFIFMQYVMPTERKFSISQILFPPPPLRYIISIFSKFCIYFFWEGGGVKTLLTQDINTVLYNTVNKFTKYQKLREVFKMLI